MDTKKIRTLISIGVVILLTVFFHTVGILRPVERFFRGLVNRASEKAYLWNVGDGAAAEEFTSVPDLEKAYRDLKERYQVSIGHEAEALLLRNENEELRATLQFVTSTGAKHLGAEVQVEAIGKNIEPLGSTIIINRGSEMGIKLGQPAIVGNGIFIGKIVRVDEGSSVIGLITDSQSKVAATVVGRTESLGMVEGGYGISVRMTWIPQQETIEPGSIVVTSGLEPGIPRGLVIGTIDTVARDPYQAFQEATISPIVRLDKVRLITIITP
jgi:rod shape-determining protein MreC